MTLDEFKDRAAAAALPSGEGGAKALDPITLAIVIAALTTVVSELVAHCMEALLAKDARRPSALQRARLRWAYVRPAVRRVIAAHPGADEVDAWAVEGLVTKGLLAAGATLTDSEFAALKQAA